MAQDSAGLGKTKKRNVLAGIGWALLVAGIAGVVGVAIFKFYQHEAASSAEAVLKWGIAAAVVGLAALLGSVIKQRAEAAKTDKYKDVER